MMKAICAPANTAKWTQVSAHDASWDHVAIANSMDLARTVFRAAVRAGNYEVNEGRVELVAVKKTAKVVQMEVIRVAMG